MKSKEMHLLCATLEDTNHKTCVISLQCINIDIRLTKIRSLKQDIGGKMNFNILIFLALLEV